MKEKLITLFKEACNDNSISKNGLTHKLSVDRSTECKIISNTLPAYFAGMDRGDSWNDDEYYGRRIEFSDQPPIQIAVMHQRYIRKYKRFMLFPINKKETLLKVENSIPEFSDANLFFCSEYTDNRILYNDRDCGLFSLRVASYIIIQGRLWATLTQEEFNDLFTAHEESIIKYDTAMLDKRLEKYKK